MPKPTDKPRKTPPQAKPQVQGLQTPRERVWAAILACAGRFSAEDAQDLCSPMVHFEAVQKYLRDLVGAGYVVKVAGGEPLPGQGARRTKPLYELVRRQTEAPRLRDGKPHTRGLGQLAMWRCMKVLATFTYRQLADVASQHGLVVTPNAAGNYVRLLDQAGYLSVVKPSKARQATVYKLSRYTGPHAPGLVSARAVLDRNLREVIQVQTAQEVCDAQAE